MKKQIKTFEQLGKALDSNILIYTGSFTEYYKFDPNNLKFRYVRELINNGSLFIIEVDEYEEQSKRLGL